MRIFEKSFNHKVTFVFYLQSKYELYTRDASALKYKNILLEQKSDPFFY